MINYSFSNYDIKDEYKHYLEKNTKYRLDLFLDLSENKKIKYLLKNIQRDTNSINFSVKNFLIDFLNEIHSDTKTLFILQKKADVRKKVFEYYENNFISEKGKENDTNILILLSFSLLSSFKKNNDYSSLSTGLKINDFLRKGNDYKNHLLSCLFSYEERIINNLYKS